MANCHKLFQEYLSNISLTASKKERLKGSKIGLRERIVAYFAEHHPEYVPKFYIQGSYKMKTPIRTSDDICDLDDGVYFFRKPDHSAATLQGWVWDAVNGYTDTVPKHKNKCIRSIFAGDYEIDMPVYYKIPGEDYQLAVKNTGWEPSDPKAMVDWFNGYKDAEGQLVRNTQYLKGWGDNIQKKMPPGIAMTILGTNADQKIVHNERDDIYLRDILKEIKKALDWKFACVVPVVPGDDLFQDYDYNRKKNFMDRLGEFLADAEEALKEPNELKASKLWRKHLGGRFPLGEDKNEDSGTYSKLIIGGASSNPWCRK